MNDDNINENSIQSKNIRSIIRNSNNNSNKKRVSWNKVYFKKDNEKEKVYILGNHGSPLESLKSSINNNLEDSLNKDLNSLENINLVDLDKIDNNIFDNSLKKGIDNLLDVDIDIHNDENESNDDNVNNLNNNVKKFDEEEEKIPNRWSISKKLLTKFDFNKDIKEDKYSSPSKNFSNESNGLNKNSYMNYIKNTEENINKIIRSIKSDKKLDTMHSNIQLNKLEFVDLNIDQNNWLKENNKDIILEKIQSPKTSPILKINNNLNLIENNNSTEKNDSNTDRIYTNILNEESGEQTLNPIFDNKNFLNNSENFDESFSFIHAKKSDKHEEVKKLNKDIDNLENKINYDYENNEIIKKFNSDIESIDNSDSTSLNNLVFKRNLIIKMRNCFYLSIYLSNLKDIENRINDIYEQFINDDDKDHDINNNTLEMLIKKKRFLNKLFNLNISKTKTHTIFSDNKDFTLFNFKDILKIKMVYNKNEFLKFENFEISNFQNYNNKFYDNLNKSIYYKVEKFISKNSNVNTIQVLSLILHYFSKYNEIFLELKSNFELWNLKELDINTEGILNFEMYHILISNIKIDFYIEFMEDDDILIKFDVINTIRSDIVTVNTSNIKKRVKSIYSDLLIKKGNNFLINLLRQIQEEKLTLEYIE